MENRAARPSAAIWSRSAKVVFPLSQNTMFAVSSELIGLSVQVPAAGEQMISRAVCALISRAMTGKGGLSLWARMRERHENKPSPFRRFSCPALPWLGQISVPAGLQAQLSAR